MIIVPEKMNLCTLGLIAKSRGGVAYLYVAIDPFSKHVLLNKMKLYIQEIGKPKRIPSDSGMQFGSHRW